MRVIKERRNNAVISFTMKEIEVLRTAAGVFDGCPDEVFDKRTDQRTYKRVINQLFLIGSSHPDIEFETHENHKSPPPNFYGPAYQGQRRDEGCTDYARHYEGDDEDASNHEN